MNYFFFKCHIIKFFSASVHFVFVLCVCTDSRLNIWLVVCTHINTRGEIGSRLENQMLENDAIFSDWIFRSRAYMYTRCSVYSILVPFLFGYLTRPVVFTCRRILLHKWWNYSGSIFSYTFWLLVIGDYNGRRASSQLMNAQHQTLVSTPKSQSFRQLTNSVYSRRKLYFTKIDKSHRVYAVGQSIWAKWNSRRPDNLSQ